MSGLFGSTTIKGNRITDFASTGARVGTPLPFGYGEFVVEGNIIWAPLPPKETRNVRRQGKGGVKQETFTYTLSYAFGLASGPIYGIKWIKRNGKIVYTTDPNAPVEDVAFAAKWLEKATIYYGTKTQLPDSTIESYEGTGQVSAFRDLCYVVIEDEDTTNNGGAPASYQACLFANSNVYLTTPPYPFEFEDTMGVGITQLPGELRDVFQSYEEEPDAMDVAMSLAAGELRSIYQSWEAPPEDTLGVGMVLSGGVFKLAQVEYEAVNEDVLQPSIALQSGKFFDALISTAVQQGDILQPSISLLSGSTTGGLGAAGVVSLLLHFDGANGSTTFTDETGKTATVVGNAQLSTSGQKFGTACGLFDGNGDYLSFAANSNFNIAQVVDFTIDFWLNLTDKDNADGNAVICVGNATGYWQLLVRNNQIQLNIRNATGGAYHDLICPVTLENGANHHIKITRKAGVYYCFYDGVKLTPTTNTLPSSFTTGVNSLYVGANFLGGTSSLDGRLDELRIIRDFADADADFTPPSSAYTYP